MAIKAVIFDVGGVLLDVDFQKANEALAARCRPERAGLSMESLSTQIGKFMCSPEFLPTFQDHVRGLIDSRHFAAKGARLMANQFAYQGNSDDFLLDHGVAIVGPIRKNAEIAKGLVDSGAVAVALLSDASSRDVRRSMPILQRYIGRIPESRRIFSFQLGKLKADGPEMFLKALEVTGVAAAEALMIDDSEHKLTHAKALGMKTLHLTKEKDLGVELAKLGVVEW